MPRRRWTIGLMLTATLGGLWAPVARAATAKVTVVAAEDFWGSIARQLGGDHAEVKSIIADPETHAHGYEPRPSDGAAFAASRIAIVNGVGYDPWAAELLAANPSPDREVINVGELVGVEDGGNPHQWYSPRAVDRTIDAITDALKQADPAGAGYFDAQRQAFKVEKLKRYNDLRSQIKAQFEGTPVGSSESVFTPMAEDLGLKILTPRSFQEAVTEGEDPTAADKATVDRQITGRQIKVLVYNSQNSTPDVAGLVDKADKVGLPVTTVTETPYPKSALFQDWQADQLQSLADALSRSTGQPASPTAAAPAPTGPAGSDSGRWLVPLAGAAVVLGGIGVAGRAVTRRKQAPLQRA